MGLFDDWRHCPRCGAEISPQAGVAECGTCGYVAYANPAPAVCALLVDDGGRVLLTRRRWEPYAGMWDLPGGFLGEDEHPLDGLRRELLEETGLEVEPVEWLGAFLDPYDAYWVLGMTWIVHAEGEPRAADDVAEVAWFGPDELPGEMAFASQNRVLRAWAERRVGD